MRYLLGAALALGLTLSAAAKPLAESPEAVSPVLNGMTLPDASVQTAKGKHTSLQALTRGKKSLLIFYRGGWCPYCNAQLQGLQKIENKLQDLGIQIIAISPDAPASAEKTQTDKALAYQLISDSRFEAAEALGIGFLTSEKTTRAYKNKMGVLRKNSKGEDRVALPVPAVFLVDEDGLIHFEYINPNFRVRVEPELILTAAQLLAKR